MTAEEFQNIIPGELLWTWRGPVIALEHEEVARIPVIVALMPNGQKAALAKAAVSRHPVSSDDL